MVKALDTKSELEPLKEAPPSICPPVAPALLPVLVRLRELLVELPRLKLCRLLDARRQDNYYPKLLEDFVGWGCWS